MAKQNLAEDIIPVTDFRTNSAELLKQTKRTHRPIILTQHGRATAIVEDIQDYEKRLEKLELLNAIVGGLQAAEKGDVIPHETVMKEAGKLLRE